MSSRRCLRRPDREVPVVDQDAADHGRGLRGQAPLGRLHALEQRHRRRPAADRHRLVGRGAHDLAEAALRPLRAQPLRVDHALARPHLVDAGPRVEDLHRRRRVDPHEEDRVAVVRVRLVAEALRPIPDDGPELRSRQDQDRDQLAVELEGLGERVLELSLDRGRRAIGAQDHVAAGDVRGDLRVAVRLEELAQGRHRHLVPAADVDAAQEDEVSGHREREDATTRPTASGGASRKSRTAPPNALEMVGTWLPPGIVHSSTAPPGLQPVQRFTVVSAGCPRRSDRHRRRPVDRPTTGRRRSRRTLPRSQRTPRRQDRGGPRSTHP